MPFGVLGQLGSRYHVLDGSPALPRVGAKFGEMGWHGVTIGVARGVDWVGWTCPPHLPEVVPEIDANPVSF